MTSRENSQEFFIDDASDSDVNEITFDEPTTSHREKQEDDYPFEVLSPNQILEFMVQQIREVNSIIQLPITMTRILLNHFKWDKEALMEQYYDGDQEKVLRQAHIISPSHCAARRRQVPSSSAGRSYGTAVCEICFNDVPDHQMTGLPCAHRFCCKCWTEYLTTKIMDEGMGDTISCAAHKCDIIVDDEMVMSLVKNDTVKMKYQQIITNSFVVCNRLMRWCPSPDCGHVIKGTVLK